MVFRKDLGWPLDKDLCCGSPARTPGYIHHLTIVIDGPLAVCSAQVVTYVGQVHPQVRPHRCSMLAHCLLKWWYEALNPMIDRAAINAHPMFSQPLHHVDAAHLISHLSAHDKCNQVVEKAAA